jgi:hypothetical protein
MPKQPPIVFNDSGEDFQKLIDKKKAEDDAVRDAIKKRDEQAPLNQEKYKKDFKEWITKILEQLEKISKNTGDNSDAAKARLDAAKAELKKLMAYANTANDANDALKAIPTLEGNYEECKGGKDCTDVAVSTDRVKCSVDKAKCGNGCACEMFVKIATNGAHFHWPLFGGFQSYNNGFFRIPGFTYLCACVKKK